MLNAPDNEKVKESKTVNNVRHLAVVNSQEWVSVKDRLPDKIQLHYIGFSPDYGIWWFYFAADKKWYDLDWNPIEDLTHWIERPAKPIPETVKKNKIGG